MSSLAVTFDSDLDTLTTESITRVSTAAHAGLPLTDDLGVRIDGRHAQGGVWIQETANSNSETEITAAVSTGGPSSPNTRKVICSE